MTEDKRAKKSHIWDRDPDDWYVEPSWCPASLLAMGIIPRSDCQRIIDPFCGVGTMLDAASAAGFATTGFDIRDRGARAHHEFVQVAFDEARARSDLIGNVGLMSNPPYKEGVALFERIVTWGATWTALLLRSKWANGKETSRRLEALPLRYVLACSPRPSMPPGAVVMASRRGERDEDGKKITVGSGTEDYSWYVFERGYAGRPEFGWCRREYVGLPS